MLKQWLSRLETVRRATTREEREAVYRFRYQVYVEEFGRELGTPDHERRWVTDDDDERETSTILYTGTPDAITGTIRLRHWAPGEVPHHDVEELSLDRFPDLDERHVAELGRLMVRRSKRGRLILASLLRETYEILAAEKGTDLVFCYCSPGLVQFYRHFGMQPFGGRLVAAPDGLMVPLVAVLSDYEEHKRMGSFLAPLVRRHFGRGKRAPLDPGTYRALLAPGTTGIEIEPERVAGAVHRALPGAGASLPPVMEGLPAEAVGGLLRQGLVIDVEPGTLVTRKGFRERELYVILAGTFQAEDDGAPLSQMGRGELFGEAAFLDPEGRRTASVRALESGRLLVLRGRSIEKLQRREPTVGLELRQRLEALFALHCGELDPPRVGA